MNLTCERRPLTDCAVRAAAPTVLRAEQEQAEQEAALRQLNAQVERAR